MLEFDEYRFELVAKKEVLLQLKDALDIDETEKLVEELTKKSEDPAVYNDMDAYQKLMREIRQHTIKLERYKALYTQWEDLTTLIELSDEMEDLSTLEEVKTGVESFAKNLEDLRLETLLSGTYDKNNAILTLHAGAGGTEAQDWVQMLYRMYSHWAEKKGYSITLMDFLPGDEAGIKSVSILIEGLNAYGYLRSERGIHRLVRISPFDSSGRRHTSFASADVLPEMDESIEVEINPDDLKIDTYRSSGAGGQHINKTSSAVRITHIPSGIVVACQNERSQHQNKAMAMKMLTAKLVEIKEREHLDKINDIKGVQKEIAWGSQIRSYVFQPYTMVKDHRTNFEIGNISAVMDGEIDGFIHEYLKAANLGTLQLK
ncbi:MAG: peptide chain release factor 2 [Clostridia bacterium]|nr:peptide chain release factor 2 [Clostridia bacterium]